MALVFADLVWVGLLVRGWSEQLFTPDPWLCGLAPAFASIFTTPSLCLCQISVSLSLTKMYVMAFRTTNNPGLSPHLKRNLKEKKETGDKVGR